jgi:hypothetical protein
MRTVTPRLVVEGMITNQAPPYTVRLTFTGTAKGARSLKEANPASGATVAIKDDAGNETGLVEGNLGEYRTDDPAFTGVVGRSYTLTVRLPDGRTYTSRPEQLTAVPAIEQVYYEVSDREGIAENAGIYVYVDTKDPAETENYYRWSAYGYSFRPSTGECCLFRYEGCGKCYTQCWMRSDNLAANLLSDEQINGNTIRRQFVYFSPIRMRGPHLIEVSQFSLTKEAYRFWERYEEQRIRTGSILDPLPEPIEGNVFSVRDPNEVALGYFSASSVTTKRIKTEFFAVPLERVLLFEFMFTRPGHCEDAWPGSEYDPFKGETWIK